MIKLSQEKIEEKLNLLYLEYSGEKQIPETELAAKINYFQETKKLFKPNGNNFR